MVFCEKITDVIFGKIFYISCCSFVEPLSSPLFNVCLTCIFNELMYDWRYVCVCMCMNVLCLRGWCIFCVTFPALAFSYLLQIIPATATAHGPVCFDCQDQQVPGDCTSVRVCPLYSHVSICQSFNNNTNAIMTKKMIMRVGLLF